MAPLISRQHSSDADSDFDTRNGKIGTLLNVPFEEEKGVPLRSQTILVTLIRKGLIRGSKPSLSGSMRLTKHEVLFGEQLYNEPVAIHIMGMSDGGSADRTIHSVRIAFSIIENLQKQDEARVTELADELNYSKSTIHNHLQTLNELGYVVKKNGRYRLSLRILSMVDHVRNQAGDFDVIKREVNELAEETGEVVQFGIEEHGKVTYLYKATNNDTLKTASSIGNQQPIYSTGLGKTILAHMPADRMSEIITGIDFEKKTPQTITTTEELYDELEMIFERGYGIDDEENVQGLRCVAAPVRINDEFVGAISISGPSSRITDDRIHEELSDSVCRAANIIELNNKFS